MASGEPLKILVFLGSTRDGRMGARVAKFVMGKLFDSGKYIGELIDPLVLKLPIVTQPLQFMRDPVSEASPVLLDLHEKIKSADAIILLTAEYNRQMPPGLTNTLDYFPPASYAYKCSGIISYTMGPQGAVAAAQQARTFLVELGALPVPFTFSISTVQNMFDENGKPLSDRMDSGLAKLMEQIEWWAEAAKIQRAKKSTPSNSFFI